MSIKIFGAELENPSRQVGQYAHGEGYNTLATGQASHAEGYASWSANPYAHAEGFTTTASGPAAHVEGYGSTASGANSHAGGFNGKADVMGMFARGFPGLTAINATRAQSCMYQMGVSTASTSATTLTFDGAAVVTTPGSTCNVLVLAAYSAYMFELRLVARRVGGTLAGGCLYAGMIYRNSGDVTLAATPTALITSTLPGTVAFTATAAGEYLSIAVTASASNTTAWLGTLSTTEMSHSS